MSDDLAIYEIIEKENLYLELILDEWELKKGKPGARQYWEVIPKNLLITQYKRHAEKGIVNDRAISRIEKIIIENYCKLYINTVIMGHTALSPVDFVSDYKNISEDEFEKEFEKFEEFAIDENGNWRISDYAIKPMFEYIVKLLDAETGEEKLAYIDLVLNIAHQRSDLASWFVEGGSRTLSILAG